MTDEDAVKAIALMMLIKKHIHPLLAGHTPEVQSAALADLASVYLAGCAPSQRPVMRQMFIDLMDDLIAPNEKLLFGDRGHPARWN